ncbi:MAG: hypothetical protein J6O09_00425 [Lachnospiraceae bacterium]|nr:hypothetical protein [Lachnospiraceae bacterium]
MISYKTKFHLKVCSICISLLIIVMPLMFPTKCFSAIKLDKNGKESFGNQSSKSAERELLDQVNSNNYTYETTTIRRAVKETTKARETTVRRFVPQDNGIKAPTMKSGVVISEKSIAPPEIHSPQSTSKKTTPLPIESASTQKSSMGKIVVSGSMGIKENTTWHEEYVSPSAVSKSVNFGEELIEPTADKSVVHTSENIDEINFASPQGGETAKQILKVKSSQKKFVSFRDESEEGSDNLEKSDTKPHGTQLSHDRNVLHKELYDKKNVIAAGGGGGLGEGGGAIEQKDYGNGGTAMSIVDYISSMPAVVDVDTVTSEETGNDLVEETFGKAEEKGEFYKENTGNHAGKKIFEIDRNGDIGIDESIPISITDNRWIMGLSIFLTFVLGAFTFFVNPISRYKKHNYF